MQPAQHATINVPIGEMLNALITHTPGWVWVVFVVALAIKIHSMTRRGR